MKLKHYLLLVAILFLPWLICEWYRNTQKNGYQKYGSAASPSSHSKPPVSEDSTYSPITPAATQPSTPHSPHLRQSTLSATSDNGPPPSEHPHTPSSSSHSPHSPPDAPPTNHVPISPNHVPFNSVKNPAKPSPTAATDGKGQSRPPSPVALPNPPSPNRTDPSTKIQVSEVALNRSQTRKNDKGESIIDYKFWGYATFISNTTLISTNGLHEPNTTYKIHFGPESNPFILDIKDARTDKEKKYLFLQISPYSVKHSKYTISPPPIYKGDAKTEMRVTLSFVGSQSSIVGEGSITAITDKYFLTVSLTFPDNEYNKKELPSGKAITTTRSGELIGVSWVGKRNQKNEIISRSFLYIEEGFIKTIL